MILWVDIYLGRHEKLRWRVRLRAENRLAADDYELIVARDARRRSDDVL